MCLYGLYIILSLFVFHRLPAATQYGCHEVSTLNCNAGQEGPIVALMEQVIYVYRSRQIPISLQAFAYNQSGITQVIQC